ncbi:hypothetical protein V6N13_060283 [Hibiscus sabdariffa]
MIDTLERSGSPISAAVQPLQKKGRSVKDLVIVEDEPMDTSVEPKTGEATVSPRPQAIPSFKDKLLSKVEKDKQFQCLSDLDVEVRDEDVRLRGDMTLLEIQFSDRVHDAIDAKLATSVVLRLQEADKEEGEGDDNINIVTPEADRDEISSRVNILVPDRSIEGLKPRQT